MDEIHQNTEIDAQTAAIKDVLEILQPYQCKKNLVPKEASQLTYKLVERLMEHNCDKYTLRIISRYLSKQDYDDLVQERVINHYCGYPACKFQDPRRIKEVQLNQLVSRLKLPRSYNSKYCCKRHYQCSEFYKKQLSTDALFSRNDLNLPFDHAKAFETGIILLDDYFEIKEEMTASNVKVDDIIGLLHEMRMDDPHLETDELIDKFTSIKIVENQGIQQSSRVYGDPAL